MTGLDSPSGCFTMSSYSDYVGLGKVGYFWKCSQCFLQLFNIIVELFSMVIHMYVYARYEGILWWHTFYV